jgi:hypothetical protein
VGTSGIWIEDDWDFTAGTLNIGPTTIAGLPAGILSVVGDLCAVIINDRAWTAAERAGVIAWGKAASFSNTVNVTPQVTAGARAYIGTARPISDDTTGRVALMVIWDRELTPEERAADLTPRLYKDL